MTIDPETLAAFADGELNAVEAARVERALPDDPAMTAKLAAHRALRETLAGHFTPIAAQPVPDRLTALLARDPVVIDFAEARAARTARAQRFRMPAWAAGGAIAASLVVGIGIGIDHLQLPDTPIVAHSGVLVAEGSLDRALTEQLSSAQSGSETRILISFMQADGTLCRGFEGGSAAGIACRDKDAWVIRRAQSASPRSSGTYRQAGTAAADILAAAQDLSAGRALDAAEEKAARDDGWRSSVGKP